MPWFKVDDNLAFHAKAVAAGNAAMGMWVRAGSWAAQQLSDGFVPAHIVATLGRPIEATKLVTAGLWDEADGGYRFHEWGERQPSREQVEADRAASRERQRRAREAARARRESREQSRRDSQRDTTVSHGPPDPTRPDPTVVPTELPTKTTAPRGARIPEGFAVNDGMREWAAGHVPLVDIDRETENFRDYWTGVAGAKGTKLDWPATWRTWMRRQQTDAENRGQRTKPLHVVGQIDLNPWRSR